MGNVKILPYKVYTLLEGDLNTNKLIQTIILLKSISPTSNSLHFFNSTFRQEALIVIYSFCFKFQFTILFFFNILHSSLHYFILSKIKIYLGLFSVFKLNQITIFFATLITY
jgi:hypothetical protein